jgi:hypothetical protein
MNTYPCAFGGNATAPGAADGGGVAMVGGPGGGNAIVGGRVRVGRGVGKFGSPADPADPGAATGLPSVVTVQPEISAAAANNNPRPVLALPEIRTRSPLCRATRLRKK